MLERPPGLVRVVPRDVHLSVAADDRAVGADEHVGVVSVTIRCQFGVTEAEPDTETPRLVEERLGRDRGHLALIEVVVPSRVLGPPAREEGGERQLGKDDETASPLRGLAEQGNQTIDHLRPRLATRDRTELSRADMDLPRHQSSPSARSIITSAIT